MRSIESKLVTLSQVAELSDKLRREGRKIVTTNGCFDLIHPGHIQYLIQARELGDVLIVGLNSDRSVRGLKGPTRPINSETSRALQLAALESVDYVTVFSESTPSEFLRRAKPHTHVKGGDYRPEDLPEREVVESQGGKVVCVKLVPGFSTSALIARLRD